MLKSIIICVILSFTWLDSAQGLCRDVTLDKCEYDQGPFEKVNAPDELTCQMFCDQVYPSKCTFWIFDKKQTLCDLFDYEIDVFTQSCKKIGGPKEPDFESCATDPDPCVPFTEGYCTFTGDILDNLDDIFDINICQTVCKLNQLCEYFLYDTELKDCKTYKSVTRDCDIIRGPPSPPYDPQECQGTPSTTSQKPTTSTKLFD